MPKESKKRSDKYNSKVTIFGTLDDVLKASVSEKKEDKKTEQKK